MSQLLSTQYQLIKSARGVLLAWCANMADDNVFKQIDTFNNKSIADMLVHNANTYIHWIMKFDGTSTIPYFEMTDIKGIADIEEIYAVADNGISDFLDRYQADYLLELIKEIPGKGRVITTTPLHLFTHATTHEFHHKGQILTMGRLLGYTPPDTDVIRY